MRKRGPDLARLRGLMAPSPTVRLLDVGGGGGAATERLATGCGQVVVLDSDPRKVASGRRRRPGIRFEEGRGEAIPFPAEAFDWVVSIVAFHHMEDQGRVLREMYRVLAPSGRIGLLELPPSRAPGPLARRLFGGTHGGKLEFLTPEELTVRLEDAGFHDVTWAPGVGAYLVTGAK